ncbi:MAG: SCO family protein [Pseudomonadota bacterium]
MPNRRFLIVAGLIAIIAAGGTMALSWPSPDADPNERASSLGGPFTLSTHKGETLSDTDLKGTPFALFFGFTHCPEICPTTLWEMSTALDELGSDADKLKMIFVSVDPERDTAELLGHYLGAFDERIIGLMGSEEELQQLGKQYSAFWKRVPLSNGGYTVDHTASVYLMDAEGRYVDIIGYGEEPEARLEKLRRLLAISENPAPAVGS